MALTEDDAWADCLGLPRPSHGFHDGLGTARGDEVCGGPCHLPLAAGERYTTSPDGTILCLACGAVGGVQ